VRFAPSRKGESKATLTIDDGDSTTGLLSVALTGSGINLPSQPTCEVALTLDSMATGQYALTLVVFDDKNQQSPFPSELKITVNP
jgi:ABC-type proline/glycine betaine transport system substrate-binding protein